MLLQLRQKNKKEATRREDELRTRYATTGLGTARSREAAARAGARQLLGEHGREIGRRAVSGTPAGPRQLRRRHGSDGPAARSRDPGTGRVARPAGLPFARGFPSR